MTLQVSRSRVELTHLNRRLGGSSLACVVASDPGLRLGTIVCGVDDEPAQRCDEEGPGASGLRSAGKSRILDELVELTGRHRGYARAALPDPLTIRLARDREPRPRIHGDDLMPVT